jgi:phytoene dehydrogenase-like protein
MTQPARRADLAVGADTDVVVIGAGHNGLVAANMLAERGLDVLVLEAEPEPGGARRSGELCDPGYISDLFSSFYPLAAASPAMRALDLEDTACVGVARRWPSGCSSVLGGGHPHF